jgi:malonyl-CoA O-methyltransferase
MINKNKVKKNFSGAKNYDGYTSYHNITLKMISNDIKNHNHGKGHLDILDAGCGTAQGYFALKEAIQKNSFDYFGLDFAFGLLKKAKSKLTGSARIKDNAYLICGDAEFIPLKDKKFDVIFSNMVLHWLNNADSFLNRCKFLLKDGGIIILSFLISGTLKEFKENFKNDTGIFINFHKFPELAGICEKIESAGLRINCSESIEHIETAKTSIELLRKINMIGAKNALIEKNTGISVLRRGLANYDKKYRNNGGMVFCTYNIGYLLLEK